MFPWLAAGAGSIVASMLSKDKGSAGQIYSATPEFFTQPGYETATSDLADYTTNRMRRLQAGQAPSWLENAMPTMREQYMTPLRENYWGGGGSTGPGMIQRSMEAASISGAGPKAVTAAARKSMQDYNQQARQVDNQLAMMRYNAMAQESQSLPEFIAGRTISATPSMMAVPGTGKSASTGWGQLANFALQAYGASNSGGGGSYTNNGYGWGISG